MRTRIIRKYCRLKHQEVVIIQEAFPGLGTGDEAGIEWRFQHCLRMDESCFISGCQRKPYGGRSRRLDR